MEDKFDYYIYIDYSEGLIGYNIIEKNKIKKLFPKISKLHHYKELKNKKEYISAMKKRFEKNDLKSDLLKWKIKPIRLNLEIFVDVIKFVKENNNCIIFMSVDDNQYYSFRKLLNILKHKDNLVIVKESKIKKHSIEYKMSLIIDTMLNIERRKLSK